MLKWKHLLVLMAFLSTEKVSAQIELVSGSKTDYQIVIPQKANREEIKAAAVLRSYLQKIAKVIIPVTNDSEPERDHEIVIGKTSRINRSETFRNEGFIIKTEKKRLFIYGISGKASLYGVYHFLDQYLGCKKFSAALEYIPHQDNINLKDIHDLQNPPYEFRQVYYPDQYNEEFRDWHKLQLLEDEWGLWGHSFDKLVPAKQYFKSHPEYYALVNGVRKDVQLCLSNPQVYQIAVAHLKELIRNQPDKKYWSVSQNDGFGYCTCAKCQAIDHQYGGPQGSVINFVNRIAANFPEKTISTLAYLYSKHPTKGLKPAKNVSIMLSTIDLDRSSPIRTNKLANGFRNDLSGWASISQNVMIWDYVVQFTNYLSPFPNQHTLADNMAFFAQNKVKGIFTQGSEDNIGEFTGLKTYLLSKLSWNPELDIKAERGKFIQASYGNAAPFIEQYEESMEIALKKSGKILDIYGDPSSEWNTWLKPELIDTYSGILDQAERAATQNTEAQKYVETERLALEYAVLQQARFYGLEKHGVFEKNNTGWQVRNGFEQKVNRFVNQSKRTGIKKLSEDGLTIDAYSAEWQKIFNEGPILHLATGKKVVANTPFNTDFKGKGIRTLTDGTRGYQNFQYNYLGWLGNDMDVVIDLEESKEVTKIVAGFLEDQRHWIFLPSNIIIETSSDNINFYESGKLTITKPYENYEKETARIQILLKNPVKARYIKLKAKNLAKLPEWRNYPNKQPWIFADEIAVY